MHDLVAPRGTCTYLVAYSKRFFYHSGLCAGTPCLGLNEAVNTSGGKSPPYERDNNAASSESVWFSKKGYFALLSNLLSLLGHSA